MILYTTGIDLPCLSELATTGRVACTTYMCVIVPPMSYDHQVNWPSFICSANWLQSWAVIQWTCPNSVTIELHRYGWRSVRNRHSVNYQLIILCQLSNFEKWGNLEQKIKFEFYVP